MSMNECMCWEWVNMLWVSEWLYCMMWVNVLCEWVNNCVMDVREWMWYLRVSECVCVEWVNVMIVKVSECVYVWSEWKFCVLYGFEWVNVCMSEWCITCVNEWVICVWVNEWVSKCAKKCKSESSTFAKLIKGVWSFELFLQCWHISFYFIPTLNLSSSYPRPITFYPDQWLDLVFINKLYKRIKFNLTVSFENC